MGILLYVRTLLAVLLCKATTSRLIRATSFSYPRKSLSTFSKYYRTLGSLNVASFAIISNYFIQPLIILKVWLACRLFTVWRATMHCGAAESSKIMYHGCIKRTGYCSFLLYESCSVAHEPKTV